MLMVADVVIFLINRNMSKSYPYVKGVNMEVFDCKAVYVSEKNCKLVFVVVDTVYFVHTYTFKIHMMWSFNSVSECGYRDVIYN